MTTSDKTVSTHRHERHGDGYILAWYDNDQVMFQSNHGRHFVQERSLAPIAARTRSKARSLVAQEVPELPSNKAGQEVRDRLEALVQEADPILAVESGSHRLNLNRVAAAREISTAFPQLGKVGAKKLHDKRPVDGWVSVPSIREMVGELFPSEESWVAFTSIVEV